MITRFVLKKTHGLNVFRYVSGTIAESRFTMCCLKAKSN